MALRTSSLRRRYPSPSQLLENPPWLLTLSSTSLQISSVKKGRLYSIHQLLKAKSEALPQSIRYISSLSLFPKLRSSSIALDQRKPLYQPEKTERESRKRSYPYRRRNSPPSRCMPTKPFPLSVLHRTHLSHNRRTPRRNSQPRMETYRFREQTCLPKRNQKWSDLAASPYATPSSKNYRKLFPNHDIPKPLVFASKTAFGRIDIKKAWQQALKRAEIANCRAHDMRHTFCNFAASQGASKFRTRYGHGPSHSGNAARYTHLDVQVTKKFSNHISDQILQGDRPYDYRHQH